MVVAGWFPSDYLVSTQLHFWLFFGWCWVMTTREHALKSPNIRSMFLWDINIARYAQRVYRSTQTNQTKEIFCLKHIKCFVYTTASLWALIVQIYFFQARCDFEWNIRCTFYNWSPSKRTCCVSKGNFTPYPRINGDDTITFKRSGKSGQTQRAKYKGEKLQVYWEPDCMQTKLSTDE